MPSVWNGKHTEIYAVPGFRSISMKSTRFSFGSAATFLGALLIVVSLSFSLASCKTDDNNDDSLTSGIEELSKDSPLIGKWQDSSYSIYEISQNEFSNYGDNYLSYAGNNLVISKTSENSGYIYIQYTKAYCAEHSNLEEYKYTYDNDSPDVGKWYAISYKSLTASSIQISGAYKKGGETSTETLEEAMAEFTIENGYFSTYSECVKISD